AGTFVVRRSSSCRQKVGSVLVVVVLVVVTVALVVVSAIIVELVEGARPQRQSAVHVSAELQMTPGGSHSSPREGVTVPSPHRALQSCPPEPQQVLHCWRKALQAARSAVTVWRACLRQALLPLPGEHEPRSVLPWSLA